MEANEVFFEFGSHLVAVDAIVSIKEALSIFLKSMHSCEQLLYTLITEIKLFQRAKCKMQTHLSILKAICE